MNLCVECSVNLVWTPGGECVDCRGAEVPYPRKSDLSKLPKLHDKLKELQAAQRVDHRKWQVQIDLIESEIQRIVRESRDAADG